MSFHICKFKELFEFLQKSKIQASEGKNTGLYKFFTSSAIQKKRIEVATFDVNALVFGTGGSASVHYVDEKFSTSTDCLVAKLIEGRAVCLKYVWHYLTANIDVLERGFKGAGLKHISKAYIEEIQIPTPSIDVQKRIAAILDKAAEMKAKREQAITKLDELAQSAFVEMFGDVKTNSKNWRMGCIGNLVRNEDALRKPVKSMDRAEMQGQYDYYGASGVIDKIDQYIYEGDRLLIGEDGANLVARSSPIAFIAKGQYWVNNHAHVLAETDEIRIKYLEYFFNKIDLKPYVTGSAQPKLTRAALDRIQVPIPSKNLQDSFVAFIDKLDLLKMKLADGIQHSIRLHGSLQHQAFTTGFAT